MPVDENFERVKMIASNSTLWQPHGQAPSYSQRVYDKSDVMFVSKNIVLTLMREDVFGTFAQMKHSLLRRSCHK
jgi:hypothetical protein